MCELAQSFLISCHFADPPRAHSTIGSQSGSARPRSTHVLSIHHSLS